MNMYSSTRVVDGEGANMIFHISVLHCLPFMLSRSIHRDLDQSRVPGNGPVS